MNEFRLEHNSQSLHECRLEHNTHSLHECRLENTTHDSLGQKTCLRVFPKQTISENARYNSSSNIFIP